MIRMIAGRKDEDFASGCADDVVYAFVSSHVGLSSKVLPCNKQSGEVPGKCEKDRDNSVDRKR